VLPEEYKGSVVKPILNLIKQQHKFLKAKQGRIKSMPLIHLPISVHQKVFV